MRVLDYQDRVLTALDTYLAALKTHKANANAMAAFAAQQGMVVPPVDFTLATWDQMQAEGRLPPSRAALGLSPRKDGCGRPVPNVTLKVPTGGGKTYLATQAVSRILGAYLAKNTGFVLWVVPNEAIYTQTLRRLKDRQDPYRQVLDRAAAGRVRIMEKGDRLDRRDVDANLCVMVLMLAAARRETKEQLRLFRDRGDVHGFTPAGQQDQHAALKAEVPNLDIYDLADSPVAWPMVKDSLGNALKIIQPIVVVDEGQKAVTELAYRTLYHDFNPIFVLELTATPKDVQGRTPAESRHANVLVEVTGRELDAEGMIKMPLHIDPRQNPQWQATLDAAVLRLTALQEAAEQHRANGGRYIRPIMLVQVERTGADQRGPNVIHADDVHERLLQLGFDADQVAIKTAQQNDLNAPENQDLLSDTNRIRVIITKQALQEGWDCPFAYVLCSLSASTAMDAMTQLVGRILRQPWATKTGVPDLDAGYVITHHAATAEVVSRIKGGLEKDGLSDLVATVNTGAGNAGQGLGARKVERRAAFRDKQIYLPKVLYVDGAEVRDLDYDADVAALIDWADYDPAPIAARIPDNPLTIATQMQTIRMGQQGEAFIVAEAGPEAIETRPFDAVYATRSISDLVPNPFIARRIVGDLLAHLGTRFDAAALAHHAGLVLDVLRAGLAEEHSARAEALFRAAVSVGRIQFRLRVDRQAYAMPLSILTTLPTNAPHLMNAAHQPLQSSLFDPVYADDYSSAPERDVAVHLDGHAAVAWWHRNVAKVGYGLQGWRRQKVYPDFIFAAAEEGGVQRIVVLETKGDHLAGYDDTTYKQAMMALLTGAFDWDHTQPAGELELVAEDGTTVQCEMVMMQDVMTALPALIRPNADPNDQLGNGTQPA